MATDKTHVRASSWYDVVFLRTRLRVSDQLEIAAASGLDPARALERSFEMSSQVWTGWANGAPFVMFGVATASLLSPVGVPWLLGTDDVEREGHAVAKRSRQYVGEMQGSYTLLENYTDNRHASAHRWLRWCGFQMEEPAPWGVQGLPFRRFWLKGKI
jgi:hypothetical protein